MSIWCKLQEEVGPLMDSQSHSKVRREYRKLAIC